MALGGRKNARQKARFEVKTCNFGMVWVGIKWYQRNFIATLSEDLELCTFFDAKNNIKRRLGVEGISHRRIDDEKLFDTGVCSQFVQTYSCHTAYSHSNLRIPLLFC